MPSHRSLPAALFDPGESDALSILFYHPRPSPPSWMSPKAPEMHDTITDSAARTWLGSPTSRVPRILRFRHPLGFASNDGCDPIPGPIHGSSLVCLHVSCITHRTPSRWLLVPGSRPVTPPPSASGGRDDIILTPSHSLHHPPAFTAPKCQEGQAQDGEDDSR
jgi:hypothetical protein